MPEKGTTDAMFALRILMEKYGKKSKKATLCIHRPRKSLCGKSCGTVSENQK